MNKSKQQIKDLQLSEERTWDETKRLDRICDNLLEKITKIDNKPNPYVEFDCPICKHTTLAKNYTDKFYVGFRSVTSVNKDKVYCFSCGKTFQMEEKKVWKEVK
jgi:hypothetical protein